MKLKFGRIVDLDKLEMASVNRNAEELKAKLDALREMHHAEAHALKVLFSLPSECMNCHFEVYLM